MTKAAEYRAKVAEARAQADRCVEGSPEQREFLAIAAQWEALARQADRRAGGPPPPPDD